MVRGLGQRLVTPPTHLRHHSPVSFRKAKAHPIYLYLHSPPASRTRLLSLTSTCRLSKLHIQQAHRKLVLLSRLTAVGNVLEEDSNLYTGGIVSTTMPLDPMSRPRNQHLLPGELRATRFWLSCLLLYVSSSARSVSGWYRRKAPQVFPLPP